MSIVYFIRSGSAGAIKVGTTNNLPYRLKALDCGPEPLSVIGTVPGGRFLEKAIHTALLPYRRRLEWFKPTDEVLAFVEAALADPDGIPSLAKEYMARHDAHRATVNLDARNAVGAISWAVDRICKRESVIAVAQIGGVSDDQITKYRQSKSEMGVRTFARLKSEWPDDFALFDLLLGLPHLTPEEVRANRATLENARAAIDAQLAKLRPAA